MKLEYLLYLTEKVHREDKILKLTKCQVNCFDDVIEVAKKQLDCIDVEYNTYEVFEGRHK